MTTISQNQPRRSRSNFQAHFLDGTPGKRCTVPSTQLQLSSFVFICKHCHFIRETQACLFQHSHTGCFQFDYFGPQKKTKLFARIRGPEITHIGNEKITQFHPNGIVFLQQHLFALLFDSIHYLQIHKRTSKRPSTLDFPRLESATNSSRGSMKHSALEHTIL